MNELCVLAVDTAIQRGASYADIRIIATRTEEIAVRNERVATLAQLDDLGIGVRVIADGSWGFACSRAVSNEDVERVASEAVAVARASAMLQEKEIALAPEPVHSTQWRTPIAIDPFTVPLDQKIETLLGPNKTMLKVPNVKVAMGWMEFVQEHQWFANSEGSQIEQIITRSGTGYSATAVGNNDQQTRSYPAAHGGQYAGKGYELVGELALQDNAQQTAEEAAALLTARQCPSGVTDVIIDGSQIGLQIHESVGHPTELDRVFGTEANFAGTSFATPEKLGTFQYGSPLVNIVADATAPGGLATIGYDDEGVAAQTWNVVNDGELSGYLTSRETAPLIGADRSNGCMRAQGWTHIPLVRMTNMSLMPGTWTLDNLIADTDDGIYMAVNRSWSIDQQRVNFQFGCEMGREIKNGKLGRLLKNPTYQGITWEFWRNCDAICDEQHWVLWGVPNCGKGEPGQRAEMSHGAAPARFRNVKVGVAYDD